MRKKRKKRGVPTGVVCPSCNHNMSTTRKTCHRYHWYSCRLCDHWYLHLTSDFNAAFQADHGRQYREGCGKPYSTGYNVQRAAMFGGFRRRITSVLDIGPGNGAFLASIRASRKVGISMDRAAKPPFSDIEYTIGDFTRGERTGNYDLVTAWHVVEHTMKPKRTLKKIVDVCRMGGIIGVEIPVDRHLATKTYTGHPHRFSTVSWAHVLASENKRLRYLYLGVGFCKTSILAWAVKSREGAPMRWGEILTQCKEGGKKAWRVAQKRRLGKWLATPTPPKLAQALSMIGRAT